ncbi:MAG: SpoIIE family protein phosphatase [Myxococcota bacterium]|nr:SpoIIE family protein phosphatase [Myxococcota bacterium]
MRWLLHALPVVVVALSSATASAQLALPPQTASKDAMLPLLRFDRLTGMAKGAVTAIAQDRRGFIWFGTDEGLSRYDGYDFVSFKPDGGETASFTVTSLAVDEGVLWVGTHKGLHRLDLTTDKFTSYTANDKNANTIASDFVVSLHIGKAGRLWVGTAESGIDALDTASGSMKHFRSSDNPNALGDDAISVVLEDVSGKVWVGTRDAGLDLLDPQTEKAKHFRHDFDDASTLSNDSVTSIYQDKTGTIWVGTMDGLSRFDPATGTFRRILASTSTNPEQTWITSIVEGNDGGLWLGIKGIGVYRLDRKTNQIEKHVHDSNDSSSISHPWPRTAFSDRDGVLWFGFNANGVSKLHLLRRHFAYYRTNPGMAFLEEGDKVWLGTQGRGVRLVDLKTGEVTSYLDKELSATWTMAIVSAGPGSYWLGTTDKGLYHYTPKSGVLDTYDMESGLLKSDAVFALLRDGDSLWIGTAAGLVRFDTVKKTASHFASSVSDPATLSADHITTIHQDKKRPDVLWVGTAQGLGELNKQTGKVVRHLHNPAKPNTLRNDHITHVHEDAAGRIWVATWGGGLNVRDPQTGAFEAFGMRQGLASDVVYGVLEDATGALWLTTNDGLTKFDPKTKRTTNFRLGDGLQGDEFAQGGFHRGASGRLFVGGPGGFNVFRPESIAPDAGAPALVVTTFELLGQRRTIPSEISLGFRDRWFSVTFAALAYASPERNRYKYRLEGFQDDWIETEHRFVTYSSLPPGDYILEILGANAHGVWNEKGLRLPIHVTPPPWRTWWAYAGYCLLVLVVVGLIWQRQRRQLKALGQAHRLSELEREIELTSAVQEGFFPTAPSVRDGNIRLEGYYRAATQCSGDWWWYEARADSYLIVVGDVTGHGAGSAMVTAAAAACFRSVGHKVSDLERLMEMNEEVLRVSRGQYHMTLTAVTLDTRTGAFLIRSAGGVPVFSLPPTGRTKVHMCPGMPLGSTDFETGVLEGQMVPGERLLIITDGIPEVAMSNAQLLGPRGVSNFYMQTRDQDLGVALTQLIKKVEAVQSGAQDDDWTAVMVQWGDPHTIAAHRDDESETVVGRVAAG